MVTAVPLPPTLPPLFTPIFAARRSRQQQEARLSRTQSSKRRFRRDLTRRSFLVRFMNHSVLAWGSIAHLLGLPAVHFLTHIENGKFSSIKSRAH